MSDSRLMPSCGRRPAWAAVLAVALAVAASAPVAVAQGVQGGQGVDPRFHPWLGCWGTPAGGPIGAAVSAPSEDRTCVVPSASVAGSVDLVAVRGDSVASRTPLPSPGIPMPRTVDGCGGEQLASWSVDNRHLLVRSTLACAGGQRRTETAVMGFTESGDWLQVQHFDVDGNAATTVARRAAEEVPERVWRAVGGGTVRSSYAVRLAMGAPLTLAQLREIATRMPAPLTEAWLAVRSPRFGLSGTALVALAGEGVPGRVIDMLVALDHPDLFAVGPDTQRAADPVQVIGRGGCRSRAECGWDRGWDRGMGWGAGPMGGWDGAWGWDPWAWRYGPMGYGFGVGAWGSPWGAPWGMGWGGNLFWGNQPVVIVPRGSSGSVAGRAVPGRGYVRERGASSAPDGPAIRSDGGVGPSGGSRGSAGGGSGGGSGGSSGGSSGGGTSTGRTAKPRGG
ncbi:MAG: hypothetical protein RLZ32_17 [Gemmatimonadota bacterium]